MPHRTLHDWARKEIFVPDFNDRRPKQWSYRDLVLVRLHVWLRTKGLPPVQASERTAIVRHLLEVRSPDLDQPIRVGPNPAAVLLGGETFDRLTGDQIMPELLPFLDSFDLFEPVDNFRVRGLNLVRPSTCTAISPSVHSGEPCIVGTRVPTATLWALNVEQGLDAASIASLYGDLSVGAVADGLDLERTIRGRFALAA